MAGESEPAGKAVTQIRVCWVSIRHVCEPHQLGAVESSPAREGQIQLCGVNSEPALRESGSRAKRELRETGPTWLTATADLKRTRINV